jgi:hypothetical protein
MMAQEEQQLELLGSMSFGGPLACEDRRLLNQRLSRFLSGGTSSSGKGVAGTVGRELEEETTAFVTGYLGADLESMNWDGGEYLYAMTLITTIGYGVFAPTTDNGKWFSIVYALFGFALFGYAMGVSMQLLETLARQLAAWLVQKWRKWRGIEPKNNKKEKEGRMGITPQNEQDEDKVVALTAIDTADAESNDGSTTGMPKKEVALTARAGATGPTADLFGGNSLPPVEQLPPIQRLDSDEANNSGNENADANNNGDAVDQSPNTTGGDKGGGGDDDKDDAVDDEDDEVEDELIEFTVLCIYTFVTGLWVLHMATVFQAREQWETLRDSVYWVIVTTTTIGFG